MEDLIRIVRSLEAVEGEEKGQGRMRSGPAQARFPEEGPDTETARIVEQILAKLGPDLHHSRERKRSPSTPGPECVHSMVQEMSQSATRDISKSKNGDKPVERNHGLSPSAEQK